MNPLTCNPLTCNPTTMTEYDCRQIEHALDRSLPGRLAAYGVACTPDAASLTDALDDDPAWLTDTLSAIQEAITAHRQALDLMTLAAHRLMAAQS